MDEKALMTLKDAYFFVFEKLGLWPTKPAHFFHGLFWAVLIPVVYAIKIYLYFGHRGIIQYDDHFWLNALDDSIIAPLSEEIFFRSLLWYLIESIFGNKIAAITTFVLFVAAHMEPVHMLWVAPMALILTKIRFDSKSIFPTLLTHSIYNTTILLLAAPFGALR